MRVILWLVAALAVLWGGYWFVGSKAALRGAEEALARMEADGLAIHGGLSVAGFPSRFDFTLDSPDIRSPDGLIRWQAPEVRAYALSYRPNHLIAVLPDRQSLRIGAETIEVTSDDLRASAVLGLDTSVPLDRAQIVGKGLKLNSDFGWTLGLSEARFATRRSETPEEQQIGAELFSVGLAGLGIVPPELPGTVDRMRLDAVLGFDRPVDRKALEKPLRLRAADLRSVKIDWGDTRLRGSGQVTIGAGRAPEGRIDFSIENWKPLLGVLVAAGAIRPEIAPTWEKGLAQLAAASGDAKTLELPLTFAGGVMSLGPIPLGPAPRF
ncbi:MAG: DUF2125 domain-containing protein [Paracoccaceae bacterium]